MPHELALTISLSDVKSSSSYTSSNSGSAVVLNKGNALSLDSCWPFLTNRTLSHWNGLAWLLKLNGKQFGWGIKTGLLWWKGLSQGKLDRNRFQSSNGRSRSRDSTEGRSSNEKSSKSCEGASTEYSLDSTSKLSGSRGSESRWCFCLLDEWAGLNVAVSLSGFTIRLLYSLISVVFKLVRSDSVTH